MPKIADIAAANAILAAYVPLSGRTTGKDITVDRTRTLMEWLGNPQQRLRVVHIAGTSGKTSTCYFAAALLRQAGKRVGLTVSPHIDSVTERVQIDGMPLSDERFCAYLGEFLELIADAPEQPTYFELLVAFAYWVFACEQIDYAVVETGMGGLHDATNIAARADKLCVITDIGYDHMHVLGHTIPEITAQKVGIAHPHNDVVMYYQSTEVNDVAESWIQKQQGKLHVTTQPEAYKAYGAEFAPEMPLYQQRNWLLAYTAYGLLRQRDSLPALTLRQLRATQAIQVPARMDIRRVGDKTIVMDGAHNGQKIATFIESFRQRFPAVQPAVMIALRQGKEPAEVVPLVAALASRVIVTAFEPAQDLPVKAIDPTELATLFRQAGAQEVRVVPDYIQAYRYLISGPEKVVVVAGSFYLVGQLRSRPEKITKSL